MRVINSKNLHKNSKTKEVSVFHHETNVEQIYDFKHERWMNSVTDKIITHYNYYVDINNGNDANDGKTQGTAFRTFEKLSLVVSGSIVLNGGLKIHIAGGNYPEILHLSYFKGEITLKTYDSGNGSEVFITPTLGENATVAVRFLNVSEVKIEGSITIEPRGFGEIYTCIPLYFINVANYRVDSNVTVSHTKVPKAIYGIVSDYSSGTISCKVDSVNSAIQSSNHSQVTILGAYFSNCIELIVLSGGTLNNYSLKEGSQKLPTSNILNSGFEFQKLNNGIIIEEGKNANGSYVKYGNGRIEMEHVISLGNVTANEAISSDWIYPHPLVNGTNVPRFINVVNMGSTMDYEIKQLILFNSSYPDTKAHIKFKPTFSQSYVLAVSVIGRWK